MKLIDQHLYNDAVKVGISFYQPTKPFRKANLHYFCIEVGSRGLH